MFDKTKLDDAVLSSPMGIAVFKNGGKELLRKLRVLGLVVFRYFLIS